VILHAQTVSTRRCHDAGDLNTHNYSYKSMYELYGSVAAVDVPTYIWPIWKMLIAYDASPPASRH
jgi:hypothetical protein